MTDGWEFVVFCREGSIGDGNSRAFAFCFETSFFTVILKTINHGFTTSITTEATRYD